MEKEDTKDLLLVGIPKKIHTGFKAKCAENNKSMKESLIEYMKESVEKNE